MDGNRSVTAVTAALAHMFRGFCMGLADVVPGVSGGTIALILGIYERLIANVRQAATVAGWLVRLRGDRAWQSFRRVEWPFILSLLAGIGTAVLLAAHALKQLLDEQPVEMTALFFGLVAASAFAVWERMRNRDATRLTVLFVTALVTYFVLGLRTDEVHDPSWYVIVGSGAVAICAMILPGISGAFILLVLGMYDNMINAVNDRDLLTIVLFLLGAVVGLSAFAPILNAGLKRHHDTVMAALIGLMVGSLRVLWPWPAGTDNASLAWPPEALDAVIPAALAVAGAALVTILMQIDRRLAH